MNPDSVFDAQWLAMKDSFARQGIQIDIAWTPDGQVDYMYVVDRLLVLDRDDNIQRLEGLVSGLQRVGAPEQPGIGDLVVLSTENLEGGYRTVPQVLDLIDERLGRGNPALAPGGLPLATPIGIVYIQKICPAGEPEVPVCCPEPCPPPVKAGESKRKVRLGVCDTGLLLPVDPVKHPWLAGVTGENDPLGPVLPGGLHGIPQYCGHGTFIAGVARCLAPETTVYVSNHFTMSGGELEYVIIQKLEQLISDFSPDLINLSAGTYTRNNWASLSFSDFHTRHGDILLVAAAGNDSVSRPFYPAAFDWTVSVGALGADQEHKAWFSNYGPWVDVYALGEGMVNAYATGVYTYQEPPKRPAQQTFDGMARWSGTSFSTPLVAGLIAAEMARTGSDAETAKQAVLALAQSAPQPISGLGPALYPPDGHKP